MTLATITFHLPSHRRRALELQTEPLEAAAAYDRYIGEYMRYLKEEAGKQNFRVETDQRDTTAVFTIDESDHEQKKAAHGWLETLPDLWNWMP